MEPTKKIRINDQVALERHAKKIVSQFKSQFPEKYHIDFLERNTVVAKSEVGTVAPNLPSHISADVLAEVKNYNTALENTKKALNWCNKNEVRVHRPIDFYAEMFKTDAHMEKVKNKLVAKKDSVIKKERDRINKKQKKFSKQLKHKKNLDAAKEKKNNLAAIDKWKGEIRKKKEGARDLDSFVSEGAKRGGRKGEYGVSKDSKGGNDRRGGRDNRDSRGAPSRRGSNARREKRDNRDDRAERSNGRGKDSRGSNGRMGNKIGKMGKKRAGRESRTKGYAKRRG